MIKDINVKESCARKLNANMGSASREIETLAVERTASPAHKQVGDSVLYRA
jgi:hypothetical protein